MASLTSKKGNQTIQVVCTDSKRRSIRLGKIPKRAAEQIKSKVEALALAKTTGFPLDAETSFWLAKIGDDLAGKLIAVGLIPERVPVSLGGFIDQYVAKRADAKPRTLTNLKQAATKLKAFFGTETDIRDISAGKADDWQLELRKHHAPAYVARLIKYGKQFFHAARRSRIIDRSPFDEIKAGSMSNADRIVMISKEDTEKIISACPTSEWRLIVALARYGGLRCPSELMALAWEDVDWDRDRFLARSSKTAHHADGGCRWVPIFPELRPHLEAAFDEAPAGQVYVFSRNRSHETNLRTAFERIIIKAGLLPWTKPFQNLRASRETELAEEYPLHVVTAWIGNSAQVAARHYLKVTDEHFEKAARSKSGAVPVQNPVQSTADRECPEGSNDKTSSEKRRERRGVPTAGKRGQDLKIRPTGVEPVTFGSEDRCSIQLS